MNTRLEEQIERYLGGALPPEEKSEFERRLAAEPELAARVERRRHILETFRNKPGNEFHKNLQNIRRRKAQKRIFRYLLWGILAFFTLFIARMAFGPRPPATLPPATVTPPDDSSARMKTPATNTTRPKSASAPDTSRGKKIALAQANFDPLSYRLRGSGAARTATQFDEAARALETDHYKDAIRLADAIAPTDSAYWPAREIAAHACFYSGDYDGAILRFGELNSHLPASLAEKVEGNLYLSYLAADKAESAGARALRRKILNDAWHPFHRKMREIEKRL